MSTVVKTLAWMLVACPALMTHAAGDADDFYEIVNGGKRAAAILQSLPYAREGDGPVMYTFQYSECPYSQGMYRDYPVDATGVEFRRVLVPVSERSAREAAALGSSRDPRDYHAFMTGTARAPALTAGTEGARIHNGILAAVTELEGILAQNGWPARGFVYPQFYWLEGGRVFTSAGYERADFGKAVARTLSGAGTPAAWAALPGSNTDSPATAGQADAAAGGEGSGAAAGGPDVDIVGIGLGMTQQQAAAAIRAHNPNLQVREVSTDILVRDSFSRPVTVGSYVAEVQAYWDPRVKGYGQADPREFISLVFASPPAEHRVVSIEREIRYVTPDSYPDHDALVAALIGKYGSAAYVKGSLQVWQLDGEPLDDERLRGWHTSSNIMQRDGHSTRHHLYPVLDERLPSNVLRVSEGGRVIQHGNRTYVDIGRYLAFHIVRQGPGVNFIRSKLEESMTAIGLGRKATADLANAALAEHERQAEEAAASQPTPRL